MSSLLQIVDGVCGYDDTTIVSSVNLTLNRGEFVILEGENGSGKSTLIKTLLGYIPSMGGTFNWSVPQTDIGYVPQDISLDLSAPASVLDVVLTAFPFGGIKVKEQAMASLEMVGLLDTVKKRFGTLSGGQRRRVLFARALAPKPSCFILDEPTVNMDKGTEADLGNLLHKLVTEDNRAVIATSHVSEWLNHSRRCEIKSGVFYE